ARLAVRAERSAPREAGQRWAEAGRLLSGPLAAPERALEAYARSVAADATNPDAIHALRALAQKIGDNAWLLEGLIRGTMGEGAYGASRDADAKIAAGRKLAELAEESGDAALAAWAYSEVARFDWNDERSRAAAARLEAVGKRRDEEIAFAER